MDQGGPHEGAPVVVVDPMDMTIIDKVCGDTASWPDDNIVTSSTFCDQPRKFNNKLLFLTVEFVDDQVKDFGKMYPSYEQVAFSPRATSPLSDFEHRVSPHDPNMSSAARYSPTPVPTPSSPFHNSAVVLQEPSSPLISTSETAVRITNGYSSQLTSQSSTETLSQSESSEDFTDSTSDELVSSVGNELMLIQGSNSELETTSTPLMLSGIPGSDLALARDFLVMQEDQINIMNSIKLNSSLDTTINPISETILPHEIDEENNVQISTMKNLKKISQQSEQMSVKKEVDWCKSQTDDESNLWHEDCDSTCSDTADYTLHSVCEIADQPVPSRAVATLPGLYLSIDKLPSSDTDSGSLEFGIFAKRSICRRTKFGPIEGIVRPYNGTRIDGLPLLLESKKGNTFLKIDVSDENSSNWMRFVRPARNYEEQNLVICQLNDGIIFLTTRDIMPDEELKAGPSLEYGKRRNLKIFTPNQKTISDLSVEFCTQSHMKTNHLEIINGNDGKDLDHYINSTRIQYKRKAAKVPFQKYLEVDEDDDEDIDLRDDYKESLNYEESSNLILEEKQKENYLDSKLELMKQEITQSDQIDSVDKVMNLVSSSIYKCEICSKTFSSKSKFQQHCLVHGIENNESLSCNFCSKCFMNNSSLTRHLKTHQKEKQTPECPVCKEAFGRVLTLKDFSETHLNQDETFTCPHCPKSFNSYALTRKHARAHHFDRKHECQFCKKCFPAADKLRMHLLKHSDRREFECANCGKQFKRKDKLKDHVTRVHFTQKTNKDQILNRAKKSIPKSNPIDCDRFIYKCRRCQVGFKRRGMLVNHLAKRHPDVPPESVPELSLPILRQTRDYYCQYCEKVYKSSSKRKAHIVKNHPGAALPPSNRSKDFDIPGLPNPTFSQAAGSIKTTPQGCQWCHKQYASKAKLLQHQRKKHSSLMEPADQIPRPRSRPPQNQNQPPTSSSGSVTNSNSNSKTSDSLGNVILEEPMKDAEFLKPRIIRVSGLSLGESVSINNSFELLNPQFTRVRDMR